MTRYPAQIVFRQSRNGDAWIGRLLNQEGAYDTQTERPAAAIECIIREKGENTFELVTHGGSKHGRHYRWFRDLTAAQNAAIAWAGRRFKIIVEDFE